MKSWKKGVLLGLFSSLLLDQQAVEAAFGVTKPDDKTHIVSTPPLAGDLYPGRRQAISREYRFKVKAQLALVADTNALSNGNEVTHAPPPPLPEAQTAKVLALQKRGRVDTPDALLIAEQKQLARHPKQPVAMADPFDPNEETTSSNAVMAMEEHPVTLASRGDSSPPVFQESPASPSQSLAKVQTTARATASATSSPAPTLLAQSGATSTLGGRVVSIAKQYLGDPYRYGGTTPQGFDCSGFIQYVFAKAGVTLPRTTYAQVNTGTKVSRQNLQPGDIVFFACNGQATSHCGLYIGNGQFIHADQSKGIAVGDLNAPYWAAVYQTAVCVK